MSGSDPAHELVQAHGVESVEELGGGHGRIAQLGGLALDDIDHRLEVVIGESEEELVGRDGDGAGGKPVAGEVGEVRGDEERSAVGTFT